MRSFGTVKDAVTGLPLSGAKIILYIWEKELAVLYTDSKGEFEHKEADQYIGEILICKVEKDGYEPQRVMQEFEEDEVNLAIKLVPAEEKLELKLNLKDGKRNPLKGVKITLEVNGEQVGVGLSDKNGIFKITLSPDLKDKTINYKAELGGFEFVEGEIPLKNETSVITLKSAVSEKWLMTAAGKIAVGAVGTAAVILAAIIISQIFFPEPPNIQPPNIHYFEADPQRISAGESSILSWGTSNSVEVEITDMGGVSLSGERDVRPEGTTTYTLIAKNEEGNRVERAVTVEVIKIEPPSIHYFEAEPSVISEGGHSTLSWVTTNAEEVGIAGIGRVSLSGERDVRPEGTTTYTLIAKNEEGNTVEREVTVEVIVPNEHSISNIQLNPPSPAYTRIVEVTFDYATTETRGVRIFVCPYTDGSPTPNYAASGSPLYPTGQGEGEGDFTIQPMEVTVDQLRFQMLSADQSRVLLYESFISVDYNFYTIE
jgi:hypothetical protein